MNNQFNDDPTLPKSYAFSTGNRLFLGGVGGVLVAAGFAGAFYFGTSEENAAGGLHWVLVVLPLAFAGLGAYLLVFVLTARLVLYPDKLEATDFFSSKTVQKTDIEGWRTFSGQYGSSLIFVLREPAGKTLKIPDYFARDASYSKWLGGLQNLDRRDFADSKKRMKRIASGSGSPGEGAERIRQAQTTAKALSWIAGATAAWGWFYPQPYALVIWILVAIPIFAMVLAVKGRGIYDLEGKRNQPRPSLAIPLIAPGCVLGLRALLDVHVLDWKPLLFAAVTVSLGLAVFLARTDPENQARMTAAVFVMWFMLVVYSYGTLMELNSIADRSEPTVIEASVVGKRISSGRSTTYYLVLGPWGPRATAEDVTVSRSVYYAVRKGNTVIVRLYGGFFHVAWYSVTPGDHPEELGH
jgi:hypothetical protein